VWLGLALVLGCHRSGGDPLDEGVDALGSAGLHVETFKPTDARRLSATSCRQGKVEGLDALLCGYDSAEAQTRAERGAEDWIAGAVTGTWTARRSLLLVVADRAHVDPSGKTMQKVVKAFAGK
jgi:hypothetical protein